MLDNFIYEMGIFFIATGLIVMGYNNNWTAPLNIACGLFMGTGISMIVKSFKLLG